MPEIDKAVGILEQFGFFQYVLPFILMFAVFYGVLRKAQVFDRDNINGTIAFVAASFTLYYAYQMEMLQDLLATFIANVGLVLLFILLAGMVSTFLFNIMDSLKIEGKLLRILMFMAIFMFIHKIAAESGMMEAILPNSAGLDEDTVTSLFIVIMVIYGVSWLAGEGPSAGGQGV
ncbi:MAG: hypothetical protein QF415_01990 [Candidatus Undinarchaeales archaeon]|jgi:hypothetical protein|nr:hypothetical protein [Candidatus Undinarchaeales archaeon]MDP7493460.1 hypothetical protein [Candidatus Undinarchaeales archaeon]